MSASSRRIDRLAREIVEAAGRPGARKTILVDLDGTLAPIAPAPELARVPRATLAALEGLLAAGWKVAVVSGRPLRDVRRMVPVAGVRAFGSHGLEGGSRRPVATGALVSRRLAALASSAQKLARRTPGARVEVKPAGIALHDRMVAKGDLASWRESARALLDDADLRGLEILDGRRVIELRLRGPHKGDVVERLAPRGASRRVDASLVAIGDDLTDEDMFAAIAGRGLAIGIGRARRGSLATHRLASPAAVRSLLEQIVEPPALS